MSDAIETYYDGSSEEENDLLELRKEHYRTLRVLQKRAARYGGAVPSDIALAIADAKGQIRAIDEARKGRIRPETAEKLGATGQFNVLAGRINLVSEQLRLSQRTSDEWREVVRQQLASLELSDHEFRRGVRMIFGAIGVALVLVAVAIFGLAGAIFLRLM